MYKYPTSEEKTDQIESSLDRYKREREKLVIRSMICSDWTLGVDFGCGTGRNFELFSFSEPSAPKRSLVGIEPDEERRDQAKTTAVECKESFEKLDLVSSIDEADKNTDEYLSPDLIVACQVFGHVNTTETKNIISDLYERLKTGGILIVCVPFHIGITAEDFFHYIDFGNMSQTNVNRIPLSEQQFNQMASHPEDNVLPVRAFGFYDIDLSIDQPHLPICIGSSIFDQHIDPQKCIASIVYSIHEKYKSSEIIGDVAVKFRK